MIDESESARIDIALSFFSENQDAHLLSELFKMEPSIAFNKGDRIFGRTGKPYGLHSRNRWGLEKEYDAAITFSQALRAFFEEYKITERHIQIARSSGFSQIEMYIGLFGFGGGHDFWLDADVIAMISHLKIDFGWSFYT